MSKERARRREQRLAEASKAAARRAKKKPRTPRHEPTKRPRRFGRLPIGARPWSQRLAIAAAFLFVQFVAWQVVRDTTARIGILLFTLLVLPAAVVVVFDRRRAP